MDKWLISGGDDTAPEAQKTTEALECSFDVLDTW